MVLGLLILLAGNWSCSREPTKQVKEIVSYESKQLEAKETLKQIYTMQLAYRQGNGVYFSTALIAGSATPNAFAPIGIEIGPTARYSYTMVANSIIFTSTAQALGADLDDDATVDTWTINEVGSLICTINDKNQ